MTIAELIAASLASEVSENDVEELSRVLLEAEKRYEEQSEQRAASREALSRVYSL